MITNSTNSTNGGYGVILADKTKIQHIHVLGTESSGIYGEDVDKVTVQNNELSGFNTAVHIFPRFGGVFNFRTYFGGIQIRGLNRIDKMKVTIKYNYIHDADTTGIAIYTENDTELEADVKGNSIFRVGKLPFNPDPFPPDRPDLLLPSFITNNGLAIVSVVY